LDSDTPFSEKFFDRKPLRADRKHHYHVGDEHNDAPFNTDQNKEDGIQDLIDEFPEGVDIFAGGLRHRKGTAVVANQQAGCDDLQ
jgi:hypothetical protein